MTSLVPSTASRLRLYEQMLTIRRFEELCLRLSAEGHIAGSIHPCLGQEAIPVGALDALDQRDRVLATYRGHGWALACGTAPDALLAEVCGRATGVNGGRGGSAYFNDPEHRFLGENSIVGGGVPLACGVALAAQRAGDGGLALVSFGEGATSQGAVHESMVLATQRRLPLVLVCENNGWSEMTPFSLVSRIGNLAERAAGYGIQALTVDGDDAEAVRDAITEASTHARSGRGPVFVECLTHRLSGHYNADIEHYRPAEDAEQARQADPLARLRGALLERGEATEVALEELEHQTAATLERAAEQALAAPLPTAETARDHIYADSASVASQPSRRGTAVTQSYVQAVNAALRRALATFPEALLFGEDVAIPGGVFGATRGLLAEFGEGRVFDTPIAESAILGTATGAAIQGLRPIAEIMWADFLLVALDQLVNQTANVRYVSRGRLQAPLVVRCQQGAAPGSCAQHSQSLEAILAHVPGLRVGLPSNANDAYQMLLAAVSSDDPCVLIESRLLYPTQGEVIVDGPIEPLGGARIRRTGDDLVLISWGRTVGTALEAAEALGRDGIAAAVLDLRWLSPLDEAQIAELVGTTSRVLVVHEANLRGGFGAEVAAWIGEHCFADLDAEVMRVATPNIRMPAAPALQEALLPSADLVAASARRLVAT